MSSEQADAILAELAALRSDVRDEIQLIRTDIQQLRADLTLLESRRTADANSTKKK